jgi:UDP-glucose 4-epimerase
MTIVVTGASGFVGGALIRRLRARGVAATGVARTPAPGVTTVRHYADTPAGDVLVHLAESGDRARVAAAGPAAEAQAADTLQTLLARGFRRVVYVSSAVVYGDRSTHPRRPDEAVEAVDAYTRIKLAGERAVAARAPSAAVARLANVYGPGMSGANVLSAVLAQIPGHGALTVRNEGPVRDFVWIDDVAAALEAMATQPGSGTFNVGSGRGTAVRELARLALEAAGEGGRAVASLEPPAGHSTLVLDVADTRTAFGWAPAVTLEQGLATLVNLQRRQHA